ncbi:hypothetical protein Cgig2_025904 [Carnegiea gigantea]|uniref:Protein MIZU-KUSSEI 1 n=1 Tax=Carnegiea gigantea TaxID=171969 RepID=A0A9Q1K632_9CARY|nr:hypothetical protein Cgig2_025904 [Carnegiea gigantea]
MKQERPSPLRRSTSSIPSSSKKTNKLMISYSSNFTRSSSSCTFSSHPPSEFSEKPLARRDNDNYTTTNGSLSLSTVNKARLTLSAALRSFLHVFSFPASLSVVPTCRWLAIPNKIFSLSSSPARKVTGTLFGHRKGHVTLAVQDGPQAEPVLLIELAISTSALVSEMSSGLVRIALECTTGAREQHAPARMLQERVWIMYCNGRKCGYANSRACTEFDWHVLSTVQTVSVGAGVIPLVRDRAESVSESEGELLYMRAKFERVVGSRDSEAFYMLNPDGNGGPELSIFFLRLVMRNES